LNFTLRPYQPSDFESLHRIDLSCYEPGIAYSRRALRSFLALRDAHCWVVCAENETLGFIIAFWQAGKGHLITIDVLESARRKGVGTALLDLAEREMSRAGVYLVELETATNNAAAIAFWKKHGYQATGVHPGYYEGRIDAFIMKKPLTASSSAK
jgi:ribosomal-protein-alanine N-acetyltransferase